MGDSPTESDRKMKKTESGFLMKSEPSVTLGKKTCSLERIIHHNSEVMKQPLIILLIAKHQQHEKKAVPLSEIVCG